MLLKKLDSIIKKYSYDCNKKTNILTNNTNELIKSILDKYKISKISSEIDDLDSNCIIIIWYDGMIKYNEQTIKFMNEHIINKKTFILIVPYEFDFDYLVKNIIANTIDAISWRENDVKPKNYLIVAKNE